MTKGTGKYIKIGSREAKAMKKAVDKQMKRNQNSIRSDLETQWIINKKNIATERVVQVNFDGHRVKWNGIKWYFSNEQNAFNRYQCASRCPASLLLIKSAKEGSVLAILLNQKHKGHRMRNLADYNPETGRALVLEEFINDCVTMSEAKIDLEQLFEGNVHFSEKAFSKLDHNVQDAYTNFVYAQSLFVKFCAKFTELSGNHRVYVHQSAEASEDDRVDQAVEYSHYIGQSGISVKARQKGSIETLLQAIRLRKACDAYKFPSIKLWSEVSEIFAKTVEAFSMRLFVKNRSGDKQIVNNKYENCDPAYLFDNEEDNLLASFLLACGLILGSRFPTDLRPKHTDGSTDEERMKLFEAVRLADENAAKIKKYENFFASHDIDPEELSSASSSEGEDSGVEMVSDPDSSMDE